MFFFSPLEQFEIRLFIPLKFFSFIDFSFTIASLYLLIVASVIIFFLFFSTIHQRLIPNRWQISMEMGYEFIFSIIQQQVGQVGQVGMIFFPFIFLAFIFILFSNLLGLLPFAFTVTSHIAITWTLALSFNLGWLFLGLSMHGFTFFKLFMPSGLSNLFPPLLVAIVLIEFVSYMIRTFSLSVRLFANMMAGHTLLYILSSFGINFLNSKFAFLFFIPFFLVVAVLMLEFGIAIIQAYVFTILISIYLKDAFAPAH